MEPEQDYCILWSDLSFFSKNMSSSYFLSVIWLNIFTPTYTLFPKLKLKRFHEDLCLHVFTTCRNMETRVHEYNFPYLQHFSKSSILPEFVHGTYIGLLNGLFPVKTFALQLKQRWNKFVGP